MLEEVLRLINNKEIFNDIGITQEGIKALNKLKTILNKCQELEIISKWNEDIIDKIENEYI